MVVLMVVSATGAAVLASLLTVWIVVWFGRRRLETAVQADLERVVSEVLPRLRAEVRAGVEEGAEAALPLVRAEVEAGTGAAAERALPEIRDAVAEGMRRGLVDSVSPEGIGRVGEEIARRGASAVEAGLERLLGNRRQDDRDDSG